MGEEEVPDGGTVSTPSIKYSSYLKVAFMNRGTTPFLHQQVYSHHILINQVVAIMSLAQLHFFTL